MSNISNLSNLSKVQEYKSTRVQEYKSTRVQKYMSTKVPTYFPQIPPYLLNIPLYFPKIPLFLPKIPLQCCHEENQTKKSKNQTFIRPHFYQKSNQKRTCPPYFSDSRKFSCFCLECKEYNEIWFLVYLVDLSVQ